MIAALLELRVTDQAEDARRAAPRAKAQGHAHADPEPVSERAARYLDTGHEVPIRVVAEGRLVEAERAERRDIDEALRGEHRVVGHRPVSL